MSHAELVEEGDEEGENKGSSTDKCKSKFERFCGIFARSFAGLSLWPMSCARSVPNEEDQTDEGIRPVVVRKSGF